MALITEFNNGDNYIKIHSEGWSGQVLDATSSVADDRKFTFNVDFTLENGQFGTCWIRTTDSSYGIVSHISDKAKSVIGISLEHMGDGWWDGRPCLNMLGRGVQGEGNVRYPAFGLKWNSNEEPTALNVTDESMNLQMYTYFSAYSQTEGLNSSIFQYISCDPNVNPLQQYVGWVRGTFKAEIETDLPIFETDADLLAWCLDPENPETLANMLNYVEPETPEEAYDNARKYKYAWNIYGHNTESAAAYSGFRNYRFYGGDGKICFYRVTPTENNPYTVKLYNYENYTIKAAGVHDTDDEDFETISTPELYFLSKSIQFSSSNYYTKFKFSTDLLVFGSESQAQMWVEDLIDARAAENFNEVSRAYNELIDPGYGNPDEGNDNGLNGQSYVHGARLWVMSSSQLNHFFDDIFDPVHISDILDGTKLLGDGINAVQGISYFPIDIDDVATVNGTADSIKLGAYTCPTATGRYVWNNNKMIDCGSLFIAPVYNDYRDYKIKLYIALPYCGFHCLDPISKYMGKNLSVKYAVDITTGGCTAYVYADGIYLGDSFDGFMASQRPLTALDQTAYLNSVMGCVSSMVSRETGMLNTAAEGIAGAASGKVSGGVGPGGAIETSAGAFGDIYKLSQAAKDTPMRTRGGFAGCLGFFGNQKIHIVTAQAKTVKPSLEQSLVGYPSHVSQTVGQFSGYLKCSYFKMANGFNGTLEELKEIIEMMQGGVYL